MKNCFSDFAQDLHYALRMFRNNALFTMTVACSLALGIGANVAVFGLVNALLLTKLPVRDPDGLLQLKATHGTASPQNRFSYPDYEKLGSDFSLFDSVIAWRDRDYTARVNNADFKTRADVVSGNFYETLGVKALLGRMIQPGDDTNAGSTVAVIGYDFWRRAFAADPEVVGRVLSVNSTPFTIIGVTPPGFDGVEIGHPKDLVLPIHAVARLEPWSNQLESPNQIWLNTLVRLRPGQTMESVRPILGTIWPRLLESEGALPEDVLKKQTLDIETGAYGISDLRTEFGPALTAVMALVILILVITCANIANLCLTRMIARRKEFVMRRALGAGRSRLLRQSLTEMLVLALLGGCAGLMLAPWITKGLLLFLPADAGFLQLGVNLPLLLFAAAVTAGTALSIGLFPSLSAARVSLSASMNETSRGSSNGKRSLVSQTIIVAQICVCLVIIFWAVLFARSLQHISNANLGLKLERTYLMDMAPGRAGVTGNRADVLFRQVLDRLAQVPEISSASCSFLVPLAGLTWWDVAAVPGYVPAPGEPTTVYLNLVSPGYFRTLGIPVTAGRDFTFNDDHNSYRAAVVNESFVRHYYGDRQAVGRVFSAGNGKVPLITNLRIIGVVADSKYNDPRETTKDLVYVSMFQGSIGTLRSIEVRFAPTADLNRAPDHLRMILEPLLGDLDTGLKPYNSLFQRVIRRDRLVSILSSIFGGLALILASMGLYGVMANAVARRTRELGIRLALGARPLQVQGLVLKEAAVLVACGLALGLPLAVVCRRFARELLFHLSASDPVVLLASSGVLMVVGITAAWIPVRRAIANDPTVSLRQA